VVKWVDNTLLSIAAGASVGVLVLLTRVAVEMLTAI
jgi:hypothetical protein